MESSTACNVDSLKTCKRVLVDHEERAANMMQLTESLHNLENGGEWFLIFQSPFRFNDESGNIMDPWIPSAVLLKTNNRYGDDYESQQFV